MKLIKCYVSSFGKLNNYEYEFNEGLNIINQQNGFGKSTFASFIKCMFYGIVDGKKYLENNERKRFTPWGSTSKFGGYVIFEHNSKQYKLERFFGTKVSEDEVSLYDYQTGKQIELPENLGQEFFGLDEDGFLSTLYFSEKDLSVTSNSSLTSKYNSTLEISTEFDTDSAITTLKQASKNYKYSGERGYLWDIQREINSLERKLAERQNTIKTINELTINAKTLEQQLQNHKNEIEILTKKVSIAGKQEAINLKKQNISQLKEEIDVIKEKLSNYDKQLNGKNISENQIELCKTTIEELNGLQIQKNSIEEDISSLKTKREQVNNSKKSNFTPLLIFSIFALLGGVVVYFSTQSWLATILEVIICSVLIFVYSIVTNKKSGDLTLFDTEIAEKYLKLNNFNKLISDNTETLNLFFNTFNIPVISYSECISQLESIVSNKKILLAQLSECEKKFSMLAKDVDLNSENVVLEEYQQLKLDLEFASKLFTEKSSNLAKINAELISQEKIADNYSDIEEKLFNLKEKKEQLLEEYEVLTSTLKFLQKADENLKIRYKKHINDVFNRYLSLLTNGKISGDIDIDFNAKILENGAEKQTDFYSNGSKQLFNICKRLALIEVLYHNDKTLIILDDPFMSLDKDNITRALNLLDNIATKNQILYFVCHNSRIKEG